MALRGLDYISRKQLLIQEAMNSGAHVGTDVVNCRCRKFIKDSQAQS